MSRGIASITWHHSRAVARAWIMFFGTKQNWLTNCMTFMSRMKRAMISRLGLSIVRAEDCQKCDIYATPVSTISGDLTQTFFFKKNFFKNNVVTVDFKVSI
jgi:predicted secreted protein